MTEQTEPTREAVLAAASEIVQAFAATDGERYFATFAPEATFVFHTEPERLAGRATYERLWADWVEGGWHVVSCASSDPLVQVFPGGALGNALKVPETCGTCHANQQRLYGESVHAELLRSNAPAAPHCVSCHTAHSIRAMGSKRTRP